MFAQLIYSLKRPYHLLKTGLVNGLPAQLRYRFPEKKLKVIMITGTDGKTTSSTLLYHVLKSAGKKVGLVSTVAAYLGEEELDTGFHVTAPQPNQIYKLMRQMVDQGFEYLVLEATSHGIYQYRTWGIKPFVAGLTNIDREHLDYHLSYENYVDAKSLLLKNAHTAVINLDDESITRVRKNLRNKSVQVYTYSQTDHLPASLLKAIKARFTEPYNQMNSRLVTAIARLAEVPDSQITKAMATFPGIPGRMQPVPNRRGLEIIVDFAHTPQALEEVLSALRQKMKKDKNKGKLIAVFGCASQRDRTKRPVMTKIAAELADYVVLTAEDPRNEDIWAIIREMKEQLTENHAKVFSIADRKEAIAFALNTLAKRGDVIGIFGKGHEQSMNIGGVELPWNDSAAVTEILATKD